MVSDSITLADIAVASHLFKFSYNQAFEHSLIFEVLIKDYELVNDWLLRMKEQFDGFLQTQNYKM